MPLEVVFEPHTPRHDPFFVWDSLLPNCIGSGALWGIFKMFLKHIMELGASQSLPQANQPCCRICCFPSFGHLEQGSFLVQNCADSGGHLPTWRPHPGPPFVDFLGSNFGFGKGTCQGASTPGCSWNGNGVCGWGGGGASGNSGGSWYSTGGVPRPLAPWGLPPQQG